MQEPVPSDTGVEQLTTAAASAGKQRAPQAVGGCILTQCGIAGRVQVHGRLGARWCSFDEKSHGTTDDHLQKP